MAESFKFLFFYQDVAPELERLRLKALTKVREFVMTRSPLPSPAFDANVVCIVRTESPLY